MAQKSNPTPKKPSGVKQAPKAPKPKKLLNGGVDPAVGQATQFQPGQSGNPDGRPPGRKSLSAWIQEMLNDESFTALLPDPRHGYKEFKGRPVEAIIQTAMVRALVGEKESREWLAKYGYGTKIDVTSDGERVQVAPIVVSDIAPREADAPAQTEAS